MPIRLKLVRKKEEQLKKVAELMSMWKVPSYSNYEGCQPIGASSLSVTDSIDPRIQKTKDLFQMFRLDR